MDLRRVARALERGAARLALSIAADYVARRISEIHPDDLIEAIERGECRISLSDEERRILAAFARRFAEYIPLVNEKRVFEWLVERVPFHAGIIYGHPRGLDFLRKCIEELKRMALREAGVVEADATPA